jgi:hypothetical protein
MEPLPNLTNKFKAESLSALILLPVPLQAEPLHTMDLVMDFTGMISLAIAAALKVLDGISFWRNLDSIQYGQA